MAKSKLDNLVDAVGNHALQLMLIWIVLLLSLGLNLYIGQIAKDSDLNLVSVSLTVFEIFLVIALAAGFWSVRGAAVERAEEAARVVARECAEAEVKEYVRLVVTPRLVRQIIEKSEDLGGGSDLTEESVNDIMKELQ